MNCDAIIEDLQAFLDDELQSNRRSEIELHLKVCVECSQMIGDLGNLSSLLKSCDVPTPNLPTGREILAKAGFKSNKENSLGFFHSIYTFLFKYKAPAIAIISAIAIFGVYINLSGTNPYSSAPSVSSQYKTQETTASNDFTKSASETPKEAIAANTDTVSNKDSQTNSTPSQTQTIPLAKTQGTSGNAGELALVEGGVEGDIEGGIIGGKSNFVSPEPPASQPPPPSDIVLPKKSAADADGKIQGKDELERAESSARAITLEKNTLAKKEAPKLEESKPNSSLAAAEELVADKAKNDRSDTYKDAPKNEMSKTKPDSSGGKGKDLDEGFSKQGETSPKESKIVAKPNTSTSSKPGFSPQAGAPVAGMAQVPVSAPAREAEEKKAFIRSVLIVIEAKELAQAKEQINEIVKGNIGSSTSSEKEQSISFTLKVPYGKIESTLSQLRKLGKVTKEKSNEDDAEKQVEDSRKTEARDSNKKSDDQDQSEAKRRQNTAGFAIINVVLQKASK